MDRSGAASARECSPRLTLRPLGSTLFIQPDRRDKTDRGLFLPTIAQDDACTGVVLAVGAGGFVTRRGAPIALNDHQTRAHARQQPLKVGDRVLYEPERAQQIPFGYGADAPVCYLIDVRDVGAVLPPA